MISITKTKKNNNYMKKYMQNYRAEKSKLKAEMKPFLTKLIIRSLARRVISQEEGDLAIKYLNAL